jgi:hypothetical protein
MAESSSIVRLATWLGKSIGSSGTLFEEFSTEFLGIDMPASVLSNNGFQDALSLCKKAAEDLNKASDDLALAGLNSNPVELTLKFVVFGDALREYFSSIESLIDALDNAISPASIPDAQERAVANTFKAEFKKKLVDYIVITAMEFVTPQLLFLLKILGLIDWGYTPAAGADDLSNDYVKKELQLYRFKDFIDNPLKHFQNTIGWGTNAFDPSVFFQIFTEFMRQEESFSLEKIDGDPVLTYDIVKIRSLSLKSPTALQVELNATLEKTETIRRTLNKTLGLNFSTTFGIDGGATLLISPPFSVNIKPNNGELTGRLKLFIDRHEFARPFDIIDAGLFKLSVNNTPFGVGLDASWNSVSGEAEIDPIIFADISKGIIKLDTSDGDSFISSLLSNVDINGNFDLGFEWSGKDGLRIKASGGIEIILPLHVDLGIVEINTLCVALNIKDSGTLSLETSAGFTGKLGPLAATVERLGAVTNLKFSENNEADLGLFDLDLDFKPPNGVGLSIDAGVVKGGGYLFFDTEREEYAGALELVFSEWITLKAIGLITTKMPDGSKGFSLLVIITVEFGSGLQLGMGFTLLGVGGLLGLSRTAKIEPLKQGVRTGAIENVMFPQDVIANAPRIISDLRKFFPPMMNIFLVGPMAKIGYGTPPLVSLTLGVILEFPSVNITILGVLKVILPDEKADILRLQVNFIGRLEPSNKLLWFYAELYDSRVLFITLEGGMGLLVNWGDNTNFVVSVGGFHPRYSPPPLPFPAPPRIAANILNESWARIRIEAYFAVTSNSVQFGARAELYFGLSAFRLEGHLAFDALFQFNPFFFSFSLSFSLSVKVFGIGLWSVGFSGLLEGPTPWHIKGKGKISLFFFSISVPFEHTWGKSQQTKLDPIKVFPLLEKELNALTNWEAVLPDNSNLLVSLRKLGDTSTDQLVLHPVGKLRISQRKIPLKFKLDKVGNQRPSDTNRLSVDAAITGGGSLSISKTEEKFAIGQFKDLDDATKLSSAAFQSLDGGIEMAIAGEQIKTSQAVKRVIRYETIIIDNNYKRYVKKFFLFFNTGFTILNNFLFRHFLTGNAVTKSVLSLHHKKRMQPFEEVIQIQPIQFSVAYNSNNKPVAADAANFNSQAKAMEFMQEQVQSDPNLANTLHVIPNSEVNLAA